VSLILLTGPVRSGKSAAAEALATARGGSVAVAVAGWDGDGEMRRRIGAHRDGRPADWTTIDAARADAAWLADVPAGTVLVLDCLGTLVSNICHEAVGDADTAPVGSEASVSARVDALVEALLARDGDSVIVSNEVGWGIVPVWPGARLFRDELGRANRRLLEAADAAYLVVDGRFLDLRALPAHAVWPM
jgi:adenosylcobinamide kinase/adenosylcobinamide-phosphate guanylyltransferase